MYKVLFCLWIPFFMGCNDYGKLTFISKLPKKLNEASGIENMKGKNLLWMHNDSGNKAVLFGIDTLGNLRHKVKLHVKNRDWEDITSDETGNLFIGDFGNNGSDRNDLTIYKVNNEDLSLSDIPFVEKIKFTYPDQTKFPPKKNKRFFDAESLLYFKGYLYIFTKSRVKGAFGKTSLYRVPSEKGSYIAEKMSNFEMCEKGGCWVTAASLSPDQTKVALLSHDAVYVFSDFTSDCFFEGKLTKYMFNHVSQKEAVTFKDNTTLYITDENEEGVGGNLYKFVLE